MVGWAGAPLGARRYVDVRGDMFEYLSAVPWFAGTEPMGGVGGRVVVDGERGELMTVPKGAKASEVRGTAWIMMLGEGIEGAIVIAGAL